MTKKKDPQDRGAVFYKYKTKPILPPILFTTCSRAKQRGVGGEESGGEGEILSTPAACCISQGEQKTISAFIIS